MTLTQPQQRKVEQNLGLVGKVIKDKVHNPGQNSIYSYDDLYQIGCIGLCKAAYSPGTLSRVFRRDVSVYRDKNLE